MVKSNTNTPSPWKERAGVRMFFVIFCLFVALFAQAAVPPYSNDMMSSTGFKMLDADGDNKTWKFAQAIDQETLETYGYATSDSPAGGCDNWLVLPLMKLEAGKYYEFAADIRAWSKSWAETFEFYVGTYPSVANIQKTQILDAQTIKHTDVRRYTAGFKPEADGNYYFAIRHCNSEEGFSLRVYNVYVDVAAAESAPAAPSDLVVTPDWGGALKADISFTTPAKNIDDSELASLEKAEIFRDGELVGTIDSPELGTSYTFTDQGMSEDYHEYAVSVTNSAGTSPKTTARRFCGIPLPAPPASCHLIETDTPGEVTMTWEPITKDADGYDINPDLVKYVVVMVEDGQMVVRGWQLDGTSYTFNALPEGVETSVAYGGVYAYTRDYSATAPGSNTLIVGKAYDLPYVESYANATPSYLFAAARTAGHGGEWGIYASASDGMTPQDNDGGFIACKIGYKESATKLMLGKFNMPDEDGIKFSFWFYPYVDEDQPSNTVDVWVTDSNNELHEVATVEQAGPVRVWKQAEIDLSEFRGQTVRIELNVTCVSITYTMLDNIRLASPSYTDGITQLSSDEGIAPQTPNSQLSTLNSQLQIPYDLQGRKLAAPQKGINIINGKKIVK